MSVSDKGTISTDTAPASDAAADYRTGVGNGVNSIAITATQNHSGATVDIFSAAGTETDEAIAHDVGAHVGTDGMVDLPVGRNVVRIQVTAENGVAVRNYFLVITRASAGASSNAKLSDLTLTGITFSPAFNKDTMMYSADVPVNITSTTVTATAGTTATAATNASSVVITSNTDDTLDPDLVTDDVDGNITSYTVNLSPGDNVITIVVTAKDYETTETYEVRIIRGESNNAYLSSLSLMDSGGMAIDLMDMDGMVVDFASDTMMYYADVANDVDMVTVSAMEMDPDASVSGTGEKSLVVGENTVEVTVTAEDGTMMTYTVMVDRDGSGDASLSSLSLMDSDGMAIELMDMDGMVVDFASDTMMYYASVANDVDMVTVSAMATHSRAMVSVDGADNLEAGENTVTVTVTAEDGTMMTYTVMVTVASAPSSLFEQYDVNGNMEIDKDEALTAIDDYLFHGTITKEQMLDIVDFYLFGTA